MSKRCETCEYWTPTVVTNNVQRGLCRASLPTMQGWPTTKLDDWCSKHQEKKEAKPEVKQETKKV